MFALAVSAHLMWTTHAVSAQTRSDAAWRARTPWGDPDLQGEWTSEGEYGVPFERPAQYGTRQVLTDEEYAKRLRDVRVRDEQDLAPVDVLSGSVQGATAPIPHWREYNTTSRRTSLVIDPPDGRLPPRTPTARPIAVQRCGSLLGGEPCDSYDEYGLGVRCIVHGGGFPDAMIPAVYNANMRIIAEPGLRRHHLRADSRYAHHPDRVACVGTSAAVARRSACTWATRAAAGRGRRSSWRRPTSRRPPAGRRRASG